MINTNHLMQRSAGHFAMMLAVSLIAGCQSNGGGDASKPGSSAAAAQSAPATAETTVADQDQASSLAPHPITPESAPPVEVTPPVRIHCGATDKMTDTEGNVWLADEGYADGDTYEVDDAQIANTQDPAIYHTERYGMTAYNFGVPNGHYTVKLHFAEVYSGITGPGDRVFSFDVQGHEFKDFDIWVKAGGPDKAYIQSVDIDVTNGVLGITFTPNVENPKVDGIEILPQS